MACEHRPQAPARNQGAEGTTGQRPTAPPGGRFVDVARNAPVRQSGTIKRQANGVAAPTRGRALPSARILTRLSEAR